MVKEKISELEAKELIKGKLSRYFTDASFTFFKLASALVPPITQAMWYGGHAAVPRLFIFSIINGMRRSGVRIAFVS